MAIIALLAGGIWYYLSSQAEERRQELDSSLAILDAQVGAQSTDGSKTYPTEDAKSDAFMKSLSALIAKYGGSNEGLIAQYYRGTERAKKNNMSGAESDLRAVADSSSSVAPLAKIALANAYLGEKKNVEAQTLLQSLTKDSSALVSKAQAQILEAQLNQSSNPQAAKDVLKSIDPAAAKRDAVKRAVEQVSSQLSK